MEGGAEGTGTVTTIATNVTVSEEEKIIAMKTMTIMRTVQDSKKLHQNMYETTTMTIMTIQDEIVDLITKRILISPLKKTIINQES